MVNYRRCNMHNGSTRERKAEEIFEIKVIANSPKLISDIKLGSSTRVNVNQKKKLNIEGYYVQNAE